MDALVVHLMAPKTDRPANSLQRAVQLIKLARNKTITHSEPFLTWQR
jgi:hypothetical protein